MKRQIIDNLTAFIVWCVIIGGLFAFSLLYLKPPTPSRADPSASQQNQAGENKEPATGNQRGTQSLPLIVKVLPSPDAEEKAAAEAKESRNKATREWWLIGLTGFLVLFTGGLAIYTARLWGATGKLVRGAEATAERQLRAYVLVSGGAVTDIENPAERKVQISIRNFGQTPAHGVRYWIGVGVREFPLRSKLAEPPDSFPLGSDVLGPGLPSVMVVPVPTLSDWEETALQCGDGAIYAYGRITYRDVFDKVRCTDVRYMCQGEGLPKGRMSPCPEGNEAT